ncbi:MAG: GNAT family N-acetyltransferase [Sporomusa sp.]
MKSDSADIFVATDNDNGVVGFMHISEDHTPPFEVFIPLKFANIIDLYVHPNFRKQGIGSKLLDAASQWAKDRELDYIELNVLFENRNAIKLYEHLGYKKVSHIMRFNSLISS